MLRWCAAGPWFPSDLPQPVRPALDTVVWDLCRAGRIEVADWVRGRGQGFRLAAPEPAADPAPPAPPPAGVVDLFQPPPPAADRAELTREAFLAPGPAIVTPLLMVACAVWFVVGIAAVWRHGEPIGQAVREMPTEGLIRLGAGFGPKVFAGDWWRLLTAGFVHTGGLHVLGNLFALALLGPVAEWLWGSRRFLALYLVSGVGATAASVALHPLAVACGASGAVWGVQTAVVVWLLRYHAHLPPAVQAEWARRLTWAVAVNALVGLLPGTAWEGHLAGAAFGVLAGGLLDRTRLGAAGWRLAAGGLGVLALPLAAGGLLAGMARYSPDWRPVRDTADPERLAADLRAAARAIDPPAVAAAVAALPDRGPAQRLKLAADAAADRVPAAGGQMSRFRAYATAVARLAVELQDPTPDPADRQRQIARRWKAFVDNR